MEDKPSKRHRSNAALPYSARACEDLHRAIRRSDVTTVRCILQKHSFSTSCLFELLCPLIDNFTACYGIWEVVLLNGGTTPDDLLFSLTRGFLRFLWKRTNMFTARLLRLFISHGVSLDLLREMVLSTKVIPCSIPTRDGFLDPPPWHAQGPLLRRQQQQYDALAFCVKELHIKASDMNDEQRWDTIDYLRHAPKIVYDLLFSEQWMDVNINGRHYTLLSGAAERHDIAQMTYLMHKGARVNAADRNDWCTPLHRALEPPLASSPLDSERCDDSVRFLIRHSAALTVPNHDELTAEQMALANHIDPHDLIREIRTTIATRCDPDNLEERLALDPETLWDCPPSIRQNHAMLTIAFAHTDAIETRRFIRHPKFVKINLANDYMAWVCRTIIIWDAIHTSDNEIFNTHAIVSTILGFATGKSPTTTREDLSTARNNVAASFATIEDDVDFFPTWLYPAEDDDDAGAYFDYDNYG